MKEKKGIIVMGIVLAICVIAFVGYNIYRYPAMFKNLSNNSLGDSEVEKLREELASVENKKVLVTYFSYSGTTERVANALSERIGGDLFEIAPQNEYSNVYMQSNSEIRKGERPPLGGTVENMEEYDIVFVGYPVWWHATPAPVNSFLESYDFSGKLVIPFCTSGGSDIDETLPTFLDSCDGLAVYGAKRISSAEQIDAWLTELDLDLGEEERMEVSGIDDTLAEIPVSYTEQAERQGNVVRLNYETNTYDTKAEPISKYAFVYLPYGYDTATSDQRYNVLYLMHGGDGTAERYLGGENGDAALKRILDHMIKNGDIEPLLVVTPTFYHNNRSGEEAELTANFHHELMNDLVPAVESNYRTYAQTTDLEGLQASRGHRAFGGFSMGSVTTWYTFLNCLDYFEYYLPISGDCWLYGQMGENDADYSKTAASLNEVIKNTGYSANDYYIYAATGTQDIAYAPLSKQIEAMKAYPDAFVYNRDFTQGNFYYGVVEGGTHTNTYMNQYIYNALPMFWKQ